MIESTDLTFGIPSQLFEKITVVNSQYDQRPEKHDKIAVFDLDDTLIRGDIGDAVFVQLKNEEKNGPLTDSGKSIPLSWPEYLKIIALEGKKVAYSRVITAMEGIPVKTVNEITRKILFMKTGYLELENFTIPLPTPDPIMKALITYLKSQHYQLYVISASNHFSACLTAEYYFDIDKKNVCGMKPALTNLNNIELIAGRIQGPVTVGQGKTDVYRDMIGSTLPLITAGNSITDIELLNLTHPEGLSIWVGEKKEDYQVAKALYFNPIVSYFLARQ